MDDGKHLDALASLVPFAGREASIASSAGSSPGGALQTPSRASATKRCSRRRRVGALLLHGGLLDSGLSARADDGTRSQERVKPSPARLALSDSSALRKEGRGTRTGATAHSPSFFQVAKVTGARGDSSPQDRPCACTACRRSEEPTFRKGRAHDRIVVAEIGRTASSSWTRAAPGNRGGVPKRNAAGGNPRGASDRPSDGRRSGSSVLAATVTGRRGRVVSAARSQALLTAVSGGLLRQAKAQGG
jgi:hypothetical protein